VTSELTHFSVLNSPFSRTESGLTIPEFMGHAKSKKIVRSEVSGVVNELQYPRQYERHRKLVQQCADGKLLCHAEERTGASLGRSEMGLS
jgi:hypothetical protein